VKFFKSIFWNTKTLKNNSAVRNVMDAKCPECGSMKIRLKLGENVCKKCGFVLEDNIVVGC
jgi:hypothetical protein